MELRGGGQLRWRRGLRLEATAQLAALLSSTSPLPRHLTSTPQLILAFASPDAHSAALNITALHPPPAAVMRSPEYGDSSYQADYGASYDDFPLDDEEKSFEPIIRHASSPHVPRASPSPALFPPSQPLSHPPLITSSPHSQPPAFTCSLNSISILLDLLSSLQLRRSAYDSASSTPLLLHATILPSGLKFSVHRSKTLSARAYLKANLFHEWRLRDEGEVALTFTVSLTRFVHVLNVFGGDGCLVLSMEDKGEGVKMEMEHEGALCDCQLACVLGTGQEDDAELNFALHPVIARGSIQSRILKAAFADMDLPGATHFSLVLSPSIPHMRLYTATEGVSVLAQVASSSAALSVEQSNPFVDWQMEEKEEGLRLQYPTLLIAPTVTVLGLSEHTNVRVNAAGMLSMQHVVNTRMLDVNNCRTNADILTHSRTHHCCLRFPLTTLNCLLHLFLSGVEYVCAAMETETDGLVGQAGDGVGGKSRWNQRLFPNEESIELE